ncbi:Rpn family recombination-promoting nuclease/putative transposase, partial [Frankia sp. CNm7]
MGDPLNPHDAVFRRVLGEPAHAASELRSVLPAGLVERLELDRLAPVPGSFVDETLRWRHSDLLFTVPIDDREAFIYVLVEHQSSNDALMAFRMLRYVTRIWDRFLVDHPKATRLPAVIPLVVHHHRRPWAAPTRLEDLVDLDGQAAEAVWEYLPRFGYLLDDLAVVDGPVLRARPLTPAVRLTLLLLKIAPGNRALAGDLHGWDEDMRAVMANNIELFSALLYYIQVVGETPIDDLHDLVAWLGPEAEKAYMTTAEMLRAEGEARGRAEMLVKLLTIRFGPV